MTNGRYNITVLVVYYNNQYSIIAKQEKFRTLRRGYRASIVSDVNIYNISDNPLRKNHLKVTITWKPSNGNYYNTYKYLKF